MTANTRCNTAALSAVIALAGSIGTAAAAPPLLQPEPIWEWVYNCLPGDPENGDFLLQGNRYLLESNRRTDLPTPGFAGARTLVGGAWLEPWAVNAARGAGGNLANRVDIVFVGDGYQANELGLYAAQVAAFADEMFRDEPLATYRPLFAVHRVDVVSNDSGVDNDPSQGINRDTAMGMAYWCNNTERLLCINVGQAYSYADTAPIPDGNGPDQVVALANSSKYGGAGYSTSDLGTAAAGNSAAVEIVVHELGHSMANLADEYTYGGPTTFASGEPATANVSIYGAAEMIDLNTKWTPWLGTNNPAFDGLHSTFEGGQYSVFGIYRPTNNSKMRSLNRPFNHVGAEAFIRQIYRTVRPIDSVSPPAGTAVTAHTTLAVTPVEPIGAPLDIQWLLNGEPIPGATARTLNTCDAGLSGTGTVSVRVRDNTPWVRNETFRDNRMTQTADFSFTLLHPGDFTGDGAVDVFDILVFLSTWNNGLPEGDVDDDGSNTVFDILAFLELWNATGCG